MLSCYISISHVQSVEEVHLKFKYSVPHIALSGYFASCINSLRCLYRVQKMKALLSFCCLSTSFLNSFPLFSLACKSHQSSPQCWRVMSRFSIGLELIWGLFKLIGWSLISFDYQSPINQLISSCRLWTTMSEKKKFTSMVFLCHVLMSACGNILIEAAKTVQQPLLMYAT